ncbi:BCCT family transporter [Campylobacter sp. faydin G-140]|uniref:BCCT family transporter n=1 Tax=Campylobacter anatolicus TaxID=2829105 RepID=UPI001BA1247B|nr:BCCT family transporter [Campylobacter anatolicus]MBR8462673.1 BCCT family transporter [Campylobacter anatolicus]MBR8466064.1 BCCT family transporter [Campylobacter anatolicus]
MTQTKLAKFNPNVFYPSIFVIFFVAIFSVVAPDFSFECFKYAQNFITKNFGWFYVLSIAIILIAIAILGFSKFGEIKLGADHSKPEFKNISWFSMLFAAGMGIGLVFFGVSEPLMHYTHPPVGTAETIGAARQAMNITFFHWGFGAWATYAIVALILAFFAYRHNLPLTLRSAFYPIIGDKIFGIWGDAIDVFAVVATLFGIATSLGYGVVQVNTGLTYMYGVPNMNITLLFVLCILATISAASGVDKGIKFLSNLNIFVAIVFMLFILFLGHTTHLLQSLVENSGKYISTLISNTLNLYAYDKGKDTWLGGWTLLYWAWWLSWSPFVGLFIAKISKGRTIREFIIGVLLVPTGFTFMWMTFFGNSAIEMVQNGFIELANVANSDSSMAIFMFLDKFNFSSVLGTIVVLMVAVFFITSADSGAMVMNMLCSNGKDNTPMWQKIFWGLSVGVVACVLMMNGGLASLQAMTISAALPFTIALMMAIFGLFRALRVDVLKKHTQSVFSNMPLSEMSKSWQERLAAIINLPNKRSADRFINDTLIRVFDELKVEFEKNSLKAKIIKNDQDKFIEIIVGLGDEMDFYYGVKLIKRQSPDYTNFLGGDDLYYRAEVFLKEGGQDYDILGWSEATIINDVIEQYRRHMQFLQTLRNG